MTAPETSSTSYSRRGRFKLSPETQINRLGKELRDLRSKYAERELENTQFKEKVKTNLKTLMKAFREQANADNNK